MLLSTTRPHTLSSPLCATTSDVCGADPNHNGQPSPESMQRSTLAQLLEFVQRVDAGLAKGACVVVCAGNVSVLQFLGVWRRSETMRTDKLGTTSKRMQRGELI